MISYLNVSNDKLEIDTQKLKKYLFFLQFIISKNICIQLT